MGGDCMRVNRFQVASYSRTVESYKMLKWVGKCAWVGTYIPGIPLK